MRIEIAATAISGGGFRKIFLHPSPTTDLRLEAPSRCAGSVVQRLNAILGTLWMVAWLAACASAPSPPAGEASTLQQDAWPLLPSDLPRPLALQQQLVIERDGESRSFDALLEVDAYAVNLAVVAMGRTALTLRWDGRSIDERRADWLPPQVDGARVLQDLQFAMWPIAVLQRAAPRGWRVEEQGSQRRVWQDGSLVVVIDHHSLGDLKIERPQAGYTLKVRSVAIRSDGR